MTKEFTPLDIVEILKILPHRYPFVMVDKVLDMRKDEWIKGIKNVTMNENFFQGHFPLKSVMPGVLVIEAMAQAGGILAFSSMDEDEYKEAVEKKKTVYFMEVDKAKFRRPVVPGDTLIMKVEILKYKMEVWKMKGECFVDDKLVAEAIMMAKVS